MKFVYPQFLFALFTLIIPILIHLFSFRRHKLIYFSDVRFLRDIKQQTRSLNKLKHLLVLLFRMLMLAALVLAFAQPFIPSGNELQTRGQQAISIYIDNSFSMEAKSEDGNLLAEAKRRAAEIARAYAPADKFQLLTNDFLAVQQRLLTREEFLNALQDVQISPASKKISEVFSRQQDMLHSAPQQVKKAFLLSDFQHLVTDFSAWQADSQITVTCVPVQSAAWANLYIDSVWFESPVRSRMQAEKVWVRIVNRSKQAIEDVPLSLTLNGQLVVPASFSVMPGESVTVPLTFTHKNTGFVAGKVSINDYPIVFDDHFYFAYALHSKLPVMAVYGNQENKSVNALFAGDSAIQFTSVHEKNLDYAALATQRLLILYDLPSIASGMQAEIKRFLEEFGGSVLFFPADEPNKESYATFFAALNSAYYAESDTAARKVNYINFKHRIFNNVFEKTPENMDLPFVKKHFRLQRLTRSANEDVLKLNNGNDFLLEQKCGKGSLFLSAVSLQPASSNLTAHALFVPMVYSMALQSDRQQSLYYTCGEQARIELSPGQLFDSPLRIQNESMEFIPEMQKSGFSQAVLVQDYIRTDGIYLLKHKTDTIQLLAFNYSRHESDTRMYTPDELKEQVLKNNLHNVSLLETGATDLTKVITEKEKGTTLWKLFIILALLFLATETLLLKFWK